MSNVSDYVDGLSKDVDTLRMNAEFVADLPIYLAKQYSHYATVNVDTVNAVRTCWLMTGSFLLSGAMETYASSLGFASITDMFVAYLDNNDYFSGRYLSKIRNIISDVQQVDFVKSDAAKKYPLGLIAYVSGAILNASDKIADDISRNNRVSVTTNEKLLYERCTSDAATLRDEMTDGDKTKLIANLQNLVKDAQKYYENARDLKPDFRYNSRVIDYDTYGNVCCLATEILDAIHTAIVDLTAKS